MHRASKTTLALLLSALALAIAACGDEEDDAGTATGTDTAATTAETGTTDATETAGTETAGTDTGTTAPDDGGSGGGLTAPAGGESPESQPGGAGDEVPISAQALVTGRGGELHPKVVRVPPFVAIRVQLRSADGVEYELSAQGRSVEAGGEIQSAATTFEGLRPQERLLLSGPQGHVTVVANAEPGP